MHKIVKRKTTRKTKLVTSYKSVIDDSIEYESMHTVRDTRYMYVRVPSTSTRYSRRCVRIRVSLSPCIHFCILI